MVVFDGNKVVKNRRIFVFLFWVLITCQVWAIEENPSFQQKQDSLLQVLSETNQADKKMDVLESLAVMNKGKSDEVEYWNQLIEIANSVDSLERGYRTMVNIGRYYAIKEEVDSLLYWANKLDSIGKFDRRAIDSQFQVYNYLCRVYMASEDELELAMNIAISQRLLAEKTNSSNGLILSSENLGLIYMLSGRYEDAASSLETCLSLLNKEEERYGYKLQVTESLIRTCIYLSEFEKAERLLDYYEDNLVKIESIDVTKSYDSKYSRCYLYTYKIWMYALQGEREKTLEAINALEPYKDALRGFVLAINKFAMAHYYFMLKDYDRALQELKPIEEGDNEVLRLKVDILKMKGDKKEVLKTSQLLLNLYKARNIKAYLRQVDQLHSLQQLNEQEKQEQIMSTQRQELKNKQIQLFLLISFSVVLAVILFFLIRYSLRTRRLRNELEHEEKFLKETNRNLEIAREKAENADRMKSTFIANISHEIRTPLNAIVGFAGLLADSSEEERTEYIQVINNNSDLLLNLVSDVLDLSRLEADNFALHLQEVNFQACCQHALGTIRHRVDPNVKVVFTHPEIPFVMESDPLRLQQLLVNLLINAAKFTEEGEICLDYRVDEAVGCVVFSVTDTGCGIPLEKQEVIFNRFEKVNDFKQGAGLGLAICKAINEQFWGKLYVDASYTAGARFVFELPLNK